MPVFQPELPDNLDAVALMDKLSLDERMEESLFTGESCPGESLKGMEALRCRFVKCDFSGCDFEQAGFRDVVFEGCDFSNCDFAKAAFQRVLFVNCKLMGTDFVEAFLKHVRFSDCAGEYVNFADCKVQDTAFESCKFQSAAFVRCRMSATFTLCELTRALFEQTPLKDFDLRTCRLAGMQITLSDLRGAVVTPLQAAELAALLGLVIRDQDE